MLPLTMLRARYVTVIAIRSTKADPVLAELWDNRRDAAYDGL